MVIRMFEYDISIALEHASLGEHAIWEIAFPQSCVLYIRNHRSLPDYHEAIVTFADGQNEFEKSEASAGRFPGDQPKVRGRV